MNPFDTPAGRQAQLAEYRLLATGTGPIADFAAEVLAGRAQPRDLVTTGWVVEDWLDALQAEADRFRSSPGADEEFSPEEAEAFLERHLAGVAALDVDALLRPAAPPVRDEARLTPNGAAHPPSSRIAASSDRRRCRRAAKRVTAVRARTAGRRPRRRPPG